MTLSRPPQKERNAGTFIALMALLIVAGGLLALTALVLPSILGILAVLFFFVFFGAFHYLVWGWWLSSFLAEEEDEPEF